MEADLIVMTLDNEDGPLVGGKPHQLLPESSSTSTSTGGGGGMMSHLIERVEEGFHSLQHAASFAPSTTTTTATTTSDLAQKITDNKDDLWAANFP